MGRIVGGGGWVSSQRRYVSRTDYALLESGFITESCVAGAASANFTHTSQQMVGANIGLLEGDTVTNVHYNLGVLGTAVTLARVGIYDTSTTPTLVASSASDTAIVDTTTGMKTVALSTPLIVTSSGAYTVALLAVFTGTAPQTSRAASTLTGQMAGVGSGTYRCFVKAGQADLPSTISWSNSANLFWFGVS